MAQRKAAAPMADAKTNDEPQAATQASDVAINVELADEDIPPNAMPVGMLRIKMVGGGYERDVTEDEWVNIYSKQIGRWEITHTGIVAPHHSDPGVI